MLAPDELCQLGRGAERVPGRSPRPSSTRAGWPRIITRISTSSASCCPSACIRISTTSTRSAAGPTIWATRSATRRRACACSAGGARNWTRCTPGAPPHPVFVALEGTVRKYELPKQPFADLITRVRAGSDRHALCRISTSCSTTAAIRRIRWGAWCWACAVIPMPSASALSDATCTALQLANFWQDVTVDLEKDRVYLPLDVLARHGYTGGAICSRGTFDAAFPGRDAGSGRGRARAVSQRAAAGRTWWTGAWRSIWICSAAAA